MSSQFSFTPTADGGVVSLLQRRTFGKRAIPVGEWSAADRDQQSAVRYLRRIAEGEDIDAAAPELTLSTKQLAEMPASIAAAVGLPPNASLNLNISLHGRVESPDGELRLDWRDSHYRVVWPRIEGVLIHSADGAGRITAPLFRLLKAIDGYNATKGATPETRIPAWAPIQEELSSISGEAVTADQLLRTFRIYQAGAFALDVRESPDGPTFDPVLMASGMRRSLADDAPDSESGMAGDQDLPEEGPHALLVPDLRRRFVETFRAGHHVARPSYALGRNSYLVVELELQTALAVVHRMQRASPAERREFLRNPRTYVSEALPDSGDEAGTLFVETRQYSDRVIGLGVWEKPHLAWITRKGTGWLPEGFVLRVGGHLLQLEEESLAEFASHVETAAQRGEGEFAFGGANYLTRDGQQALDGLRREIDDKEQAEYDTSRRPEAEPDNNVLLIDQNFENETFKVSLRPRPLAQPQMWPEDDVLAEPKPHQRTGFGWLVEAWKAGLPGVLLADDMGLGKTLQALAFLAWFRRNRELLHHKEHSFDGPILIVAPTALLRNWLKEAEIHLRPGCLGECVEAFGPGLRRIKMPRLGSWTPEDALDVEQLRAADWILTTYETLATYHRAFARVAYAVAIFDETQKIKAPDTINSHAAKTMNADFVMALTGTPIENRIEDIWCIMDRVMPGYLGDLKAFSKTYGGDENEAALKDLKARLDAPKQVNDLELPPIMLRRMKSDHLKGLPERHIRTYPKDMPPQQAQAYEEAVAAVQHADRSPGDMLKAVHRLRGVSLHPAGGTGVDAYDPRSRETWVAGSARVLQTLEILHAIREKDEKALLFIEDRDVQQVMAALLAAEFDLPAEPEIINGATPGDRRQALVDRFQAKPHGFDVLILSPKAAGVGLTITAANHVVHLSRWWNPAVEDQCNDRVYRIGQARPVTVHIPIARHPVFGDASFDVKLNGLLDRRRALSRDMLAPPVSEGDAAFLYAATVSSVVG